jgi:hypothetical protein
MNVSTKARTNGRSVRFARIFEALPGFNTIHQQRLLLRQSSFNLSLKPPALSGFEWRIDVEQ